MSTLWLSNELPISRCPHCNIDYPNAVNVTGAFNTSDYEGKNGRTWKVYACRRCGGTVLAGAKEDGGEITEIYPEPSRVNEDIPERARTYLEQAVNSIHAPIGAVILAASAVDAMLKEKGYKKGDLYPRIEQAAKDHLITEGMSQWAHQVRLDANAQRHADDSTPLPTTEDAKRSIDFAKALGQFLFVLPARVTRGIQATGGTTPSP